MSWSLNAIQPCVFILCLSLIQIVAALGGPTENREEPQMEVRCGIQRYGKNDVKQYEMLIN